MNGNDKSFEEINKHIEDSDLSPYFEETVTVEAASSKLCGIYGIVRPILVVLSKLPHFA